MTPLRRRPDAAAGWNFALVVRAAIVAVLSPKCVCCQVSLQGARESSRGIGGLARGTAVTARSRKRRGSMAYLRTL